MLAKLFLIFILVPMADLVLLVLLGRVNLLIPILTIIASGIAGAWLIRRQGLAVGNSLRSDVVDGKIPTESIMDGGMLLLAAGLLLTPGLITDIFGMSFLVPRFRSWYRKRIKGWIKTKVEIQTGTLDMRQPGDQNTVDGEFSKSEDGNVVDEARIESQ